MNKLFFQENEINLMFISIEAGRNHFNESDINVSIDWITPGFQYSDIYFYIYIYICECNEENIGFLLMFNDCNC